MHSFNIVVLLFTIGYCFGNFVAIAIDTSIYHYINPLAYAIVTSSVLFALGVLWIVMAVWPDGRFKGGRQGDRILDAYNRVMTSPYYSASIWIGWGAFFLIFVLAIGLLWTYIGLFGGSPDPQIGSGGVVPFGTSAESDYYFNLMFILELVFLLVAVAQIYHFSAYYRAWIRTKQLADEKHVNHENPQGLQSPGIPPASKKLTSVDATEKVPLTRDRFEGSRSLVDLPIMTSTVMANAARAKSSASTAEDEIIF